MDLVSRCAIETEEPSVRAVQRFLEDDPLAKLGLDDDLDQSAVITFRVGQVFPTDLRSVQEFWARENDTGSADAIDMQCVVCRGDKPVLERLQGKIKGVPGGQGMTSGLSVISANADAYLSYGLEASLIAPTCADCGERFTKAANALLASESNRVRVGGSVFVYWTKEKVDVDIFSTFNNPDPQQVQALVQSVRSGQRRPEVDDVAFYATSLSGSGGRAVVRDWLDTTVWEVKRHLADWFQRQYIVSPQGDEGRPFGLLSLADATVRERNDLPPTTPRVLLRAAFTGTPLPWDVLYRTVKRVKAQSIGRQERGGRKVTQEQAALIKSVLLSQRQEIEEDAMVQLDQENSNPAYRCGRLLAVLEEAQRAAISNLNTTVVDRFYGTASSAPASVFSRLLKGVQPHLAKLHRDNRGAYFAIQSRLEQILSGLSADAAFPRTLTLEEQGLFALGYYHQRAHSRAEMIAAAERRRQNGQTEEPELNPEA
jgi:CRISPR-associated protein Csd1